MNFTINNQQLFPVGTTVKAYPASNWPTGKKPPEGAPVGAAVAEGVVAADGSVTFAGLTEGLHYYAGAEVGGTWRYERLMPSAPAPTATTNAATIAAETAAREAADTALGARLPFSFRDHGFNACSVNDPATLTTNMQPEAGKPIYTKVPVRTTTDFSTIRTILGVGGSGVVALENCYLAVFNSAGERLGKSADQKAAWNAAGEKAVPVVADAGKSLVVEGSANAFVWIELLVGTQSTVALQFASMANSSGRVNFGMAANGKTLRVAQLGAGKAAPAAAINPAELVTNGVGPIGFGA